MRECIEVMVTILRALAKGECKLPLRQIMWLPDRVGALGLMPSYWTQPKVVGLKAVTFFPGNEGTELDSHQGTVMLFESQHGRLPDGAIVLLRTGFGERWKDRKRYLGTELSGPEALPELHFPGLAPDAARWLVAERRIGANVNVL